MRRRPRWRRAEVGDLRDVMQRLERWECDTGGAVRHMFPLSALEGYGVDVLRVAAATDGRWACAVILPGHVLVPCGDPEVLAAAGNPERKWRLLVGDAAASDALLGDATADPGARVHVQRYLTVQRDRVPTVEHLPDPGVRRATPDDLARLADLAVQLHVDDGFGPDPGRSGWRGYASRLSTSIDRGNVFCVGPVGQPLAKIERSVSSARYGVQLAGICVDRQHRGEGIGTAMVAAAVRAATAELEPARPISLHVRADNIAALRAYVRSGFVDGEEWRLAVRA